MSRGIVTFYFIYVFVRLFSGLEFKALLPLDKKDK